jgi:single-strand DNA-binding protein
LQKKALFIEAPCGMDAYIQYYKRFILNRYINRPGEQPVTGSSTACRTMPKTEAFMNNLNSILIEGALVRDPLLRTTPKGTSLCTFSLASNRFFKQDSGLEREVGFFDVETWAKLAEHCYSMGRKGRGVRVVGRLKQSRWTGQDGKQHSRISIVAEHVEFKPEFKNEGESPQYPGRLAGEAAGSSLSNTGMPDPEFEETPRYEEVQAVVY